MVGGLREITLADKTSAEDKRRHQRHEISKPVRARVGGQQGEGTTRDISAGGAALDIDIDVKVDDLLELDIDDVGFMEGQMSRSLDDGFAVRFVDLNDEEEEQLLADLEDLKSSMDLDDI